jgi:hypothetical protein
MIALDFLFAMAANSDTVRMERCQVWTPVVNKNGLSCDMQSFERYSIRIVIMKHAVEAWLNCAQKYPHDG